MRADARCNACGALLRKCIDLDGRTIFVEVHPRAHGTCWPKENRAGEMPVMAVVGDPKDVPASEPFRYVIHTCPARLPVHPG